MSKTLFRPVNYLAQSCRIWKDRMRLRLGFVSPTALTRPSQGFRRQWVNTLVIPDQTSTTPALEHLATYWLSTQWPWAGQVLLNGCAHANDYRRGPRPSKPLSVAGRTRRQEDAEIFSEIQRPSLSFINVWYIPWLFPSKVSYICFSPYLFL